MVGCGRYCIVGNNLTHNFQETILMPRIERSTVNIVNKKMKLATFDLCCQSNFLHLISFSCLIFPQVIT